jgi:serine/threonine protein kinase
MSSRKFLELLGEKTLGDSTIASPVARGIAPRAEIRWPVAAHAATIQFRLGGGSVMAAQVIDRGKLGVLDKIGQGGQGVVYRAPNVRTKFAASMVYKEYKAQTLALIDSTALAAMPALVEDALSYSEGERLISLAAWPCAIVHDGGALAGFVMPAIPEQFFIELTTVKGVSSTIAEFQHLLNHESVLAARGIDIDDVQRYSLLREVASGLAFLHKHGVCVGDISPKNLLFSLSPHEAVHFIDCDAMRINAVSALPQVETPGWEVRRGEELATIYSDAYKLGLLALRLVTGDQDTKNPQHLPAATPTLLRQIITDTLNSEPNKRPLPEAWSYILGHAIELAQHDKLTTATQSPTITPLTPPTVPVLRSRPSKPSPTAPPPPRSRPPAPTPPPSPPAPAPDLSGAKIFAGIAVVAAVIIGAVVVTANVVGGANNSTTASSSSSSYSASSPSYSAYPSTIQSTAPVTPRASGPPPGVLPDPDQWNDSCNGFSFPGSPTHVGRGSNGTSCGFAKNVLQAYLTQAGWGSGRPVQIDVASPRSTCPEARTNANPAPPTAIQCLGFNFLMTCTPMGSASDPSWVDCRGGNLAEVYLW